MIPASVRIWVCSEAVDMRRSFDGLALAARQQVGEDVQNGAMVAFINKRMTRLKVLWFERNGLCILYTRLHRAVFRLPRGSGPHAKAWRIDSAALEKLREGVPIERKQQSVRLAS